MKKLNTHVKNYFIDSKLSVNKTTNFLFSGSDEAGEGEHKIFEKIRNEKKS